MVVLMGVDLLFVYLVFDSVSKGKEIILYCCILVIFDQCEVKMFVEVVFDVIYVFQWSDILDVDLFLFYLNFFVVSCYFFKCVVY